MSYTFKQRESRVYVYSKIIHFIEYDEEYMSLKIGFNDGQVGHFKGVPPELYSAFEASGSKGNFFYKYFHKAGFKSHYEVA